jgi:hypothetical protein
MAPDDTDPSEAAGTNAPDAASRAQDPFVARRRPDPAQPPEATTRMFGFLGDSDRPGFRRLYFTRDLNYYAEFRVDDVVELKAVPADQPPFRGDEATRLTLRRDANIEYTRDRTPQTVNEFDADVRLGRRRRGLFFDRRRGVNVGRMVESDPYTDCHDFTCYGTCAGDVSCCDQPSCDPPGGILSDECI